MSVRGESRATAIQLLEQVEAMLKEPSMSLEFGRGGVNTSVALIGVQGLVAYFLGDKARAAEDLVTAGEEIAARLSRDPK